MSQEGMIAAEEGRYVVFSLAEETFALPVQSVREVVEAPRLTPVPRAPWCVDGITNLRGSVVPVVNLAKRMDLGEEHQTENGIVVVVEWENEVVGLLVDQVMEVIPIEDYQTEGVKGEGVAENFVVGIARLGEEQLVLLLDLVKLLTLQ